MAESVEVLAGGGPADVVELTIALAREMVALAGLDADPAEVLRLRAGDGQLAGHGAAQGGDPDAALPTPKFREIVVADTAGVVSRLDALSVGVAAWRLGAGRARREHDVQQAAGILCRAKPGDVVAVGQPLFELHTDTPERFPAALADLADAVDIAAPGTVVDEGAAGDGGHPRLTLRWIGRSGTRSDRRCAVGWNLARTRPGRGGFRGSVVAVRQQQSR